MANFKTNAPADILAYITENGSATINDRPKGFWTDMITIYVNRMYGDDVNIKISQGSGGRGGDDYVESDGQAALYFAEALTDAANLVIGLERMKPELVKAFDAYKEFRRQEFKAEIEAQKAAREADQPMTNQEAVDAVNDLIAETKKSGRVGFSYTQRGTRRKISYIARRTPSGRVTIRKTEFSDGPVTAKNDLIALLSEDACGIQ